MESFHLGGNCLSVPSCRYFNALTLAVEYTLFFYRKTIILPELQFS